MLVNISNMARLFLAIISALLVVSTAQAASFNVSAASLTNHFQALSSVNGSCEIHVSFLGAANSSGPSGDTYDVHPRSNCTRLQAAMNMTVPVNMSRAAVSRLIAMKARVIDAGSQSLRKLLTVRDNKNEYLCYIDPSTGSGYLTNGPAYANGYMCSYANVFSQCVCGFDMAACNDYIFQTETAWLNAGCSGRATSKAQSCYYRYYGLAASLDSSTPSCTGCSTSQCTSTACANAGASC